MTDSIDAITQRNRAKEPVITSPAQDEIERQYRLTERNVFASRMLRVEVLHLCDPRRLCRECGREWPCRTYTIASGREDA